MIEGAEFSVMRFRLAEGESWCWYQMGLQKPRTQMANCSTSSGFTHLMRKGKSASEVADAAQRFGQEDDISVIAVTPTVVLEPALA